MVKRYGYIPDLPDKRDHYMKVEAPVEGLPPSVDLRPEMPLVYDQGDLGSCTGNAIAAALQYDRIQQNCDRARLDVPSRLFIYYYERVIEHTVSSDSGAQIRDGIKVVNRYGACFEDLWPYDVDKFDFRPSPEARNIARKHEAVKYERVSQTENAFKACLAKKLPLILGFTVYESFESDTVSRTGIVPMPEAHERSVGGHAVLVSGYDDADRRFIVRNSWGPSWGQSGYFTIPYEYFLDPDLAEDIWNIQQVSQ